ncbi:hypothetical protein GCM10027075_28030 [Streptomyces heilongjiangensis]
MDAPASSQAPANTAGWGAQATASRARTPRTEPVVITARGPRRSRTRPTGMPVRAETRSAPEKAPVVTVADQPVAAVIRGFRTGKA